MKIRRPFGKTFNPEKVIENYETLKSRHPHPNIASDVIQSVVFSNFDSKTRLMRLVWAYMKLGDILMSGNRDGHNIKPNYKVMTGPDIEEVSFNIVVENIFNEHDIRLRKVVEYLWIGELLSAKQSLEKVIDDDWLDIIAISKQTLGLPTEFFTSRQIGSQ